MKRIACLILTGVLLTSVGCSSTANKVESTKVESTASSESQKDTAKKSDAAKKEGGYTHIDMETAKKMMANDDGHVIVDVRSQEEYNPIFNSWIVEKWLKTLYLQGFSHFFLLCKKCCMERLG